MHFTYWYVSNVYIIFDTPCLFMHHLLCVLLHFCGVFMCFPELTYWWDATVLVPYFLLFLCFRKAIQEIFSELDETKAETSIFPEWRTKTEREPERGQRATTPGGGTPLLAAPGGGEAPLVALWRRLSAYLKPPEVQTLNRLAFSQ
jgi:hypothetical protein